MIRATSSVLAVLFGVVLGACASAPPGELFSRPAAILYGASVAETNAALEGKCTTLRVRRIDPPFAPEVRHEQLQIDCDGFPFLGAPRWAEFVFRDDSLEMVWIMMSPTDQDRTLAAMAAAYGAPTHRNGDYVAFSAQGAAWRFQPAEVLFYSPALAGWTDDWFQ
jgi:hypothetical protein